MQRKFLNVCSESRPIVFAVPVQGFLTAMRQETTRSNLSRGWALDTVTLSNDVTKMMREDVSAPPPDDVGGVYIYGLFLDGAGWDRRSAKLTEAPPKVSVCVCV